jgi:2-oxo-4-hydroxy-4-carboxy-5-ureidoimidazoline decarboxylase
MNQITISRLNQMGSEEFVGFIGPVFENSPWIAREAWIRRPFDNPEQLHRALCAVVKNAGEDRQIALIRAHPDLVGRAALVGTLTPESAKEQAAAGLNVLSTEEIAWFQRQNAAYQDKFGFPFVICARLNKKTSILNGFEQRLKNSRPQEIQIALEEIFKIAEFRLRDLISSQVMPAKLSTHVLDTTHGCPAAGMKLELWSLADEARTLVTSTVTNADGRTDEPLLSATEMKPGSFEIMFFVGDYFAAKSPAPAGSRFLDRVPVRFQITDAGASYHVPLLCSPWSYSTYRGS